MRRRRKFDDDDDAGCACGWWCCHLLNIVWAVLFGYLYYNYRQIDSYNSRYLATQTPIDATVEWILKQLGEGSTLEEHPIHDKWWISRPIDALDLPFVPNVPMTPALEWVLLKLGQGNEIKEHNISDIWWRLRPQSAITLNASSISTKSMIIEKSLNTYGLVDFWPSAVSSAVSSRRLEQFSSVACRHCTSYWDYDSCLVKCAPHTHIGQDGKVLFSSKHCQCQQEENQSP